MFPNSADAPTAETWTSWMKSTPGSERATPLHGQVVFMPSMRNWFSLVPEPNAEIVVTIPLDGEVGDTPGAALTKSNMLARRVGIAPMSSEPKRVPNPGFRASIREPVPIDHDDSRHPRASASPPSLHRRARRDQDVLVVQGRKPRHLDLECRHASGRQDRKPELSVLVREAASPGRPSVPVS